MLSIRKTILSRLAVFLFTILTLALVLAVWIVKRQGLTAQALESYPDAVVRLDGLGIPTIEAPNWERLLSAEGYVVASERMWQMDLLRRKAGGRLAAWFGEPAFAHDAIVQAEDRIGLAKRSADALPDDERRSCETYAAGVNRFIAEQTGRWGLEYALLRVEPEPWTCADTLLIALAMTEMLTATAETEAEQWVWRRHLSPAWQAFLYPEQHPWNEPLFGQTDHRPPALPPAGEWIVKQALEPVEAKKTGALYKELPAIGSNGWAWRGKTGHFLANDPHLATSVPSIWYAIRLKVDASDWVVGTAIPGLPGVILGMNPAVAWAFTNTGEDVDDYLEEHLNADQTHYELRPGVWVPVVKKSFDIAVKGEAKPRTITAQFTERGPLAPRAVLGSHLYARQWLALQTQALRLPTMAMMRAKNLDELERGVASMHAPAQNVMMMDRAGSIRYRTSGMGPRRRRAGNIPLPAFEGAWAGFEPQSERHHLELPAAVGATAFLATANERIWTDGFGGHNFYQDDRKDRLRKLLSQREDFSRADMELMQHDTLSRFRLQLLNWVAARSGANDWQAWDGNSRSNPGAFAEAALIEDEMTAVLLQRVSSAFLQGDDQKVKYQSPNKRAWMLAVLEAPGDSGLEPFGLRAEELAKHLLAYARAQRQTASPYPATNRWAGQHPFVGRIPIVGRLFAVESIDQWGAADVVAAERPNHGPSMRVVWDMSKPWESTWAFPVGQSGHVGSRHFHDFQSLWINQRSVPVFPDDDSGWGFHAENK